MVDEHNPIHIEAKTLELALVKAGAALGVPHDQVAYRVLKKESGLATLFSRKKVELHVWQRNQPTLTTDSDNHHEAELQPEVEQRVIDEISDHCRTICQLVSGTEVVVTARREGKRLIVNIDDDWLFSSATRYPKVIEALEHLLRKKPRHLQRSLPFRIFVDVKQHRLSRENEQVQAAKELAAKVVADQRPLVMECHSPHERRAIHIALDKDDRIHTKSIGRGFERRLMILPSSRSLPKE